MHTASKATTSPSPGFSTKLPAPSQEPNFPSQTLALETIIHEAYQKLETSQQFEENPLSLELALQEVLGDELYKRHIDFLEEKKKEGQTLENVFRNFINQQGIKLTTEQWLQLIKQKEIDHFKVGKPEPCPNRAIDPETKKWYCDGKKIPPAVCVARQQRALNHGWKCHPKV